MKLEELKTNATVRGILPDCLVTVVGVQWLGSEALAAAAIPARRRPGGGQDHHGRAPHQGADRARRPATLPRRLSRQPRRTMAGRALPPVPASLRDPDQRPARNGASRQLVSGGRSRHRAPRQAGPRRGRSAQAPGARLRLRPHRVRRGAQDVGDLLRRRDQVHLPTGSRRRKPICTGRSPTTCARSSIGRKRSATTSGLAPSASP